MLPQRRFRKGWAAATLVVVLASVLVADALVLGTSAQADPASELDAATTELAVIRQRIDQATEEREALEGQLGALFARIDANRRSIESSRARSATALEEADALTTELGTVQLALDRRAAVVYMQGPATGLQFVLGASTMAEAQEAVVFAGAVARSDRELIDALVERKARLRTRRHELADLTARLREARERLETHASAAADSLQRQQELIAQLERDESDAQALIAQLAELQQRALAESESEDPPPDPSSPPTPAPEPSPEPEPSPTPPPEPPPPPPDPGPGAVQQLIVDYFTPQGPDQVEIALCVAEHESHFDPNAQNPYSGAAGVFQFMPEVWPSLSEAAGWGGSSVFDAEANVAVAAWTVQHYGWSPWAAQSDVCGF